MVDLDKSLKKTSLLSLKQMLMQDWAELTSRGMTAHGHSFIVPNADNWAFMWAWEAYNSYM